MSERVRSLRLSVNQQQKTNHNFVQRVYKCVSDYNSNIHETSKNKQTNEQMNMIKIFIFGIKKVLQS